ncbi:exonuclease-1 [Metschnikowia aff. pulcherrima]|uniref:Exonuclease-1 n=1 Tax=Metschnikowia aff. pulcherrima TaxID=2163413 RepID=A0A4P6XPI3_9ASCO|nr:exonuclease-1 [Metschnikowia aff. pulcherrima]
MGVTGLLQQLKEIQHKTTLSQYSGKKLAVDTYGWLHRGLISCAQDLCTDAPTRGYVTSVMKKVDMLRHFGVEPVMVFDGAPLPTKEGTLLERRLRREKARENAQLMVQKGDRKGAWKEFMKAAAVTPEMAKLVMVELDRHGVAYVVAPYEADPQMVYLEKTGAVDGILSEDSDLLVFGCRRLITKLNDYGECIEICRDDLHKVPRMALDKFTPAQWRLVAILSGCDYTKGIPGVGLKTAFNVVLKLSNLEKIVASFRADNKLVPEDFLEEAYKADLAFQYQKVFDPKINSLSTLCEVPSDVDLDVLEVCCGRRLDANIHAGICQGKLHPFSHDTLISREHNLSATRSQSIAVVQTKTNKGIPTPAASQTSQSFTSTRTIESYFKRDEKAAQPSFAKPNMALKRTCEKTTQLSPSSKKLKRFQTPSGAETTLSKFFASSPPTIPPVLVLLQPKPSDADFGFITGDSEVPDSSSPVKDDESSIAGYATDDDADMGPSTANSMANSATYMRLQASASTKIESDCDDGYENDIDESPIKTEKISISWRQRFAMEAVAEDSTCKPATIRKSEDVRVTTTNSEKQSDQRKTEPEEAFCDSLESSSSPQTPEEIPERPTYPESAQLKSLQQTFMSDIDETIYLSPQRVQTIMPQKSSASKLLRFAFTGK